MSRIKQNNEQQYESKAEIPLKQKRPLPNRRDLKYLDGAEDETRTRTGNRPPPPQDGVSTNSTTSAQEYNLISGHPQKINQNYLAGTAGAAGPDVTGAAGTDLLTCLPDIIEDDDVWPDV